MAVSSIGLEQGACSRTDDDDYDVRIRQWQAACLGPHTVRGQWLTTQSVGQSHVGLGRVRIERFREVRESAICSQLICGFRNQAPGCFHKYCWRPGGCEKRVCAAGSCFHGGTFGNNIIASRDVD